MIDFLGHLDQQIFLFLNSYHNHFFDTLMWWFSSKYFWIPLYLYFIFLVVKKYGWESVAILLTIAILIALSDQISGFIKDAVERLRPTHAPEIRAQVHFLNGYLGGNYGFVSAHASNSFALAYFLFKFLNWNQKTFGYGIFVWAAMVSYSRIYLGVHYPGDIIGGAILGLFLGWLIVNVYNKIISRFCFSKAC